jgi:Bacterial TSP3 repeat
VNGHGRFLLPSLAAAFAVLFAVFAAPALAKDTNHDKIPDSWEKKYNLSLKVKQTRRDPDRDKLDNLNEYKNGTNPRKADTDGDGLPDGLEVSLGLDPTDPDADGDGIPDGEDGAGVIASFDGTTLTINMYGGGTLSGIVDPDITVIACDRSSPDPELDNQCAPSDLVPGVKVSDATFDDEDPGVFDEIDLVDVF